MTFPDYGDYGGPLYEAQPTVSARGQSKWPYISVLIMLGVALFLLPVVALFYWVPPLVIRHAHQTASTDDRFVRRHATTTLNAMLTGLVGILAAGAGVGLLYVTPALGGILLLAALAHGVATIVCTFMGLARAGRGEAYTFPRWWIAFPFLREDS